jgi:hypothetical protein
MAKITLENGMVFEGANDELMELFAKMGVKFPAKEAEEATPGFRKVSDREARVGDFVKFSETEDDDITVGKFYEIIAFDFDNDPEFIDDEGDENVADPGTEEFEIYEKIVAEPALEYKVGGYARLKSLNDPLYGFRIGQIVKLHDNTGSASDFKVTPVNGGRVGYSDVKNFEPVSEEELAEIDAEQAEKAVAAKWASINRKPNEFKKGDIVRGKRTLGDKREVEGTIEDIGKEDFGIIPFNEYDGYYSISSPELITPVESRFDR